MKPLETASQDDTSQCGVLFGEKALSAGLLGTVPLFLTLRNHLAFS